MKEEENAMNITLCRVFILVKVRIEHSFFLTWAEEMKWTSFPRKCLLEAEKNSIFPCRLTSFPPSFLF